MTNYVSLPDECKQEFYKLRDEEDEYTENLSLLTEQLQSELTKRRVKYVTRKEILSYPSETHVFNQLGKAFLISDVKSLDDKLRTDLGNSDQKILKIKKTGAYLVSMRDGVRKQISDLVSPYVHTQ